MISQIASAYYFGHFLIILPLLSRLERTLPLPNSITESVLGGESSTTTTAPAAPAH
jgi:ubiquinol-cytochrome c reductase cytochrome b subunit